MGTQTLRYHQKPGNSRDEYIMHQSADMGLKGRPGPENRLERIGESFRQQPSAGSTTDARSGLQATNLPRRR